MKMIINGEPVNAAGGETYDIINPYSGKVIDKAPLAGGEDYELALACAREAQTDWYGTPLRERIGILGEGLSLVKKNYNEIVSTICSESGKLISEAKKERDSFFVISKACL